MSCTAPRGFYWWEIDITYYGLKALSWTGFIWGLKPVPKSILEEAARADHAAHHRGRPARRASCIPITPTAR